MANLAQAADLSLSKLQFNFCKFATTVVAVLTLNRHADCMYIRLYSMVVSNLSSGTSRDVVTGNNVIRQVIMQRQQASTVSLQSGNFKPATWSVTEALVQAHCLPARSEENLMCRKMWHCDMAGTSTVQD